MKKSIMYAIVAVVVIIIIVAGVAAFLLYGNGGGTTSPTATPTSTPLTVAGATSLQFTVDETTSGGSPVTYDYSIQHFNASNEELRVDIPGGSAGNYSYIINLTDSSSHLSIDNGVTWTVSDFATDSNFAVLANNYVIALGNWNGHDATYTYTAGEITNVISAIHIDPTLPDSMFATS